MYVIPRWTGILILACVYTLAAPAYFVVQTMLADQLSASTMCSLFLVLACVLVTLVLGVPRMPELRALPRLDLLKIAVAGVLGVFASQYLVLANRLTDAPPGSEVLFFTTASWGVLVVLAAFATRRRPSVAQVLSAGMALAATAAVLANWERPSSFSPFVRYPAEHVGMLLGGVAWAAFGLLTADLASRMRLRNVLPTVTACGAVGAVIVALLSPGRTEIVTMPPDLWIQLAALSSTFSAMLISWSWIAAWSGVAESAALLFLPTVTLTVFGIFERRMSAFGPSPILWEAVTWAVIATLAGAFGVATLGMRSRGGESAADTDTPARPRGAGRWLSVAAASLAACGVLCGLVALAVPALGANVRGTNSDGTAFRASWTLPGAETPGGWIALLAGLLALTAAVVLLRDARKADSALLAAAVAGVGLISVRAVELTPLRAWTRWIPLEIQQEYGTEYARLTLERTQGVLTTLALALAGAGAVLAIVAALTSRHDSRGDETTHEPSARHSATGHPTERQGGVE